HGTNRVSARRDLGNYPDLVFITPCPPSPGAGEHFQPTDRLGDNTMFSIHSKPNGPKPGRRLADQDIIRKVGAEHRLRYTDGPDTSYNTPTKPGQAPKHFRLLYCHPRSPKWG